MDVGLIIDSNFGTVTIRFFRFFLERAV